MGAKIVLGGIRNGTYFDPTILSGVTSEMSIFKEETFGPAIDITTFKNEKEAIALSNNPDFGLGVSIFTQNMNDVERLASQFDEERCS